MRRSFHVRVAKALARRMGLDKDCERILVRAIVEPDRRRRRKPRERHHVLRYHTILDRLLAARTHYLNGDLRSCLWNLGIALHYIQDAHLPSPRTRYLQRLHSAIEQKSGSLSLAEVMAEVDRAFHPVPSSFSYVEGLVSQIRWAQDPEKAVREAIRASAAIVAAVFGPREPPAELIARYRAAEERVRRELEAAKRSLRNMSLAFAFLFIVSAILGGILAAMLLLLLLLAVYALHRFTVAGDPEYQRLRMEALWYGIR